MATPAKKISNEDLHKMTVARRINSGIWVFIIIFTAAISNDSLLLLLMAELFGWFYMDRSFISEVLKSKKGNKNEPLDSYPEE